MRSECALIYEALRRDPKREHKAWRVLADYKSGWPFIDIAAEHWLSVVEVAEHVGAMMEFLR